MIRKSLLVAVIFLCYSMPASADTLSLVCDGFISDGESNERRAWSLEVNIDLEKEILLGFDSIWKETSTEKSILSVKITASSIKIQDTNSTGEVTKTYLISRIDGSVKGGIFNNALGIADNDQYKGKCSKASDREF